MTSFSHKDGRFMLTISFNTDISNITKQMNNDNPLNLDTDSKIRTFSKYLNKLGKVA